MTLRTLIELQELLKKTQTATEAIEALQRWNLAEACKSDAKQYGRAEEKISDLLTLLQSHVLVPIEPTEEMKAICLEHSLAETGPEIYAAMIAPYVGSGE